MGSKTRLGSYCTKRANNGVNLVTSRNINTRLVRPIVLIVAPARSLPSHFLSVEASKIGVCARACVCVHLIEYPPKQGFSSVYFFRIMPFINILPPSINAGAPELILRNCNAFEYMQSFHDTFPRIHRGLASYSEERIVV